MFKLENAELARRLDELRGADVTDLSDEIALARLLTEVAVNRGQVGLAGQLLHTTAKLELAAVVQREKLNHLLDSSASLLPALPSVRPSWKSCPGFPTSRKSAMPQFRR